MEKIFVVAFLLLSINATAQVQATDASQTIQSKDSTSSTLNKKLMIEGGSIVQLKLMNEISSKTANTGDQISFTVFDDVTVGKQIVIKAGTLVTGTIENAQQAKGLGKGGELSYSLNYAKAVDGTKIYLRTTRANLQGQDRAGGAVALAVVVSPLFLLHKGKNVTMEAGKIVQAFADRDYTIENN
jgi:hypothetical protein